MHEITVNKRKYTISTIDFEEGIYIVGFISPYLGKQGVSYICDPAFAKVKSMMMDCVLFEDMQLSKYKNFFDGDKKKDFLLLTQSFCEYVVENFI